MHNSSIRLAKKQPKQRMSRKGRAPANKGQRFPAELLTREEVQRLIGGCSRRAPTGRRNAALLAVMYRSGLRVSEALDLRPKDICPNTQTVRVLCGKGSRARTVGIDAGGLALLDAWLEVRKERKISRSAPLFCTLGGGPVSATYVRQMIKRMALRAGIEKRVHPHQLRHVFACELVGESVPLPHIQRLLGHSSLATTSTYLAGLRPQEAIDAIIARPSWTPDGQPDS